MQRTQTHLPSELRMCKVSDAVRQASHLKVLLLIFSSVSTKKNYATRDIWRRGSYSNLRYCRAMNFKTAATCLHS